MTILRISNSEYKIEIPGLENVVFTETQSEHINLPKAVDFTSGLNTILQSTREAGAFNIEIGRKYDRDRLPSGGYQITRTAAIYFKTNGKFHVAIDDIIDPAQNIAIVHAKDGYKSHSKHNTFFLPLSDPLVNGALSRAEKTGRILEVEETSPLELTTSQTLKSSQFGKNCWSRAMLADVAELYAETVNKHANGIGRVLYLTLAELEALKLPHDSAEIRWCGVGELQLGYIDAKSQFGSGYARGVRGAKEFIDVVKQ